MLPLVRRGVCGAVLVGGVVFLAACGSSDDSDDSANVDHGGGTGSTTAVAAEHSVTVEIVDAFFVPDEITIPAGKVVELTLENTDAQEHDFQVDRIEVDVTSGGATSEEHAGAGAGTLAVHTQANETNTIVFMAMQPGDYEFYCTIEGHKDAGMVGTLTVE